MGRDRFFLSENDQPWREVPLAEFVRAERAAGFTPRTSDHGQPATSGFAKINPSDGSGIKGRIVTATDIKLGSFQDEPEFLKLLDA